MATRVAAYVLCVRDGEVLLAHWRGKPGDDGLWTLPGGGVEDGEDPLDAAVREVLEETGYTVEVDALLGLEAVTRTVAGVESHSLRVLYAGRVVGGELTFEVDGSTDMAGWHPLAGIPALERATAVDTALALAEKRPSTGRLLPGTGTRTGT